LKDFPAKTDGRHAILYFVPDILIAGIRSTSQRKPPSSYKPALACAKHANPVRVDRSNANQTCFMLDEAIALACHKHVVTGVGEQKAVAIGTVADVAFGCAAPRDSLGYRRHSGPHSTNDCRTQKGRTPRPAREAR
jgi:hypothetical protein